jgi:hypothetical protein
MRDLAKDIMKIHERRTHAAKNKIKDATSMKMRIRTVFPYRASILRHSRAGDSQKLYDRYDNYTYH